MHKIYKIAAQYIKLAQTPDETDNLKNDLEKKALETSQQVLQSYMKTKMPPNGGTITLDIVYEVQANSKLENMMITLSASADNEKLSQWAKAAFSSSYKTIVINGAKSVAKGYAGKNILLPMRLLDKKEIPIDIS